MTTPKVSVQLISMTVAVAAITITSAIIHGRYLNRWGEPPNADQAAKKIAEFPKSFGEWEMISEGKELTPSVQKELGLLGYVHRVYRNQRTAVQVSMLFMVGEFGPMVRHPPEICYGARANTQLEDPQLLDITSGDAAHEFTVLRFESSSLIEGEFSVCYGFGRNGAWSSPDNPRWEFGAEPLIYKMQALISGEEDKSKPILKDALEQFMLDFVDAAADSMIDQSS